MKIMIEAPDDVNTNVVLDVVKDFIKKTDKDKNGLYFVQLPEHKMTIALKETSAGNIIARVR
ncbi:hypothetical protein [Xenorhabdus bovienii]|uniref:hypothetical protein n=1 Tax=Xenorhabdus bovienii TaxID=40576 RepID=UPI00237C854C|nr:hypothetical protein [Xenorhabdus bovienii]MDE1483942.1 hypothetical protein [Xenorhabdus bovienii]MDE1492835.1 hypothetical protein [Xenorhabdus bovienii]MDE9432751.1 hypothetical protein [Xenorhabdus bovienii]MDE9436286.1 hypothetical protein [Xenorhabdus bovienii]MDE9443449.1 hypothetical protein [Xenorhabdus bovienii]